MGAALVAVATVKWSHVSEKAFRVLVRMAVVAHDHTSATTLERRYFGGHDALAEVLGCQDTASEATRLRYVREAIAELEQRGAIRLEQPAWAGRNATYELTLDAVPMPAKPRRKRSKASKRPFEQEGERPPTKAAHWPPTEEGERPPTKAAHWPPTPYKEEELLEETLEERFEDPRAHANADSPAADVLEADRQESNLLEVDTRPPTLRVVRGGRTDDTDQPRQPGLWPVPVDNPVRDLTAGEKARIEIRALLQGRKRGRASA